MLFRSNFPGLTPTTQTTAGQLLAFMAGSVASASQRFFITSPTQLDHWTNYLDQKRRVIEPHENEMSVFFKDDWKVSPSFTLNAGVRWQYYGAPYEGKGLTIRPQGGQGGLALGARLRRLGVPTIVLERNARAGDNWRRRYKSLCLHDPVWYDHKIGRAHV